MNSKEKSEKFLLIFEMKRNIKVGLRNAIFSSLKLNIFKFGLC